MAIILVADDNRTTTRTLASLLEHWGHQALQAFDGAEALAVIEAQEVDVLVTDLRMPAMDGMELLRTVRQRRPEIVVIVVTAYGSVETAVEAMQLGAFDFLCKPYEEGELRAKLVKAVAQHELMDRLERVDARLASFEADSQQGMGEIIGTSPVMQEVFEAIRKVGPTDSTVLVLGETGTGKELVARAVHQASSRRDQAFVPVHCAAYAESLLESELFGHERGAFTGAVKRKLGRIELADGGTFFLDEVGEIPLEVQVKLLRVLQEREFERVGGTQTLRFDTRIVAATNRDLEAASRDGRFRQDLYYRLNVFTISLPPLRQRREDIPALVDALRQRQALRLARTAPELTARALDYLQRYDWPGNVRELQNVIERATILAEDRPIDLDHLPLAVSPEPAVEAILPQGNIDFDTEMERYERRLILRAYEASGRVKAQAARILGIDRNRLRYKLGKFGIDD